MEIDLFFFKVKDGFDLILILTFFIILITFFFYIKNYLSDKHPYHSQQYWEGRYSVITKRIEWYLPFEEMRTKFKFDDILKSLGCDFKNWKVLDLGCGNSTLPLDVKSVFI